MVDLFLLPPNLCFLELLPAVVEFVTLSEVLVSIVSIYYCARRLFGALHDI
jgi:hypothetical protein